MSFINGSESVAFDPEHREGKRRIKKSEYTLEEAAIYWAGYFQIGRDDINAMFDYKAIFNMFFEGSEKGHLELCGLVKYDCMKYYPYQTGRLAYMGASIFIEGVEYEFDNCMVTRKSLIEFSKFLDEYPLFLFPNGRPVEEHGENYSEGGNNKDVDDVTLPKLERQKNRIIKVLKEFDYDPLSVRHGEKAKTQRYCADKYPTFLAKDTFLKAWQLGLDINEIRTVNHDKYSSKKNK